MNESIDIIKLGIYIYIYIVFEYLMGIGVSIIYISVLLLITENNYILFVHIIKFKDIVKIH